MPLKAMFIRNVHEVINSVERRLWSEKYV